jgi:hypothetical protein
MFLEWIFGNEFLILEIFKLGPFRVDDEGLALS